MTQTASETAKMAKNDTISLFAIGHYDGAGTYLPFTHPVLVKRYGYALLTSFGHTFAIMDEDGAWLEPELLKLGFRSEIKVQSTTMRQI